MTESMSVAEIAETIAGASPDEVTIEHLENPRVELEEHHYNVVHSGLVELGLEPHLLSDTLIESLFEITKRYAHRVRLEALRPTVKWREPTAELGGGPHAADRESVRGVSPGGRATGTGSMTGGSCYVR